MPLVFVPGPTVNLVVLHVLLNKEEQQLVINIYNAGCSTFIAEEREAPEDWRAHTQLSFSQEDHLRELKLLGQYELPNSTRDQFRGHEDAATSHIASGPITTPWWYNM